MHRAAADMHTHTHTHTHVGYARLNCRGVVAVIRDVAKKLHAQSMAFMRGSR